MTDQQQAQQTPDSTQGAPMPSAEQQTTQDQASTQVDSSQGLPEGVSDRTAQQFERLTRELREERQRRERLELMTAPRVPEPQMTPVYDPVSGLLNEGALTDIQQRALAAEQRAARAESSIQAWQEEQAKRELIQAYPQVDPESKDYDPQLDELTASIYLHSQVAPQRHGNKQLSYKEAADKAMQYLSRGTQKAKEEGAQGALEQLTPKEQAALAAQGNAGRRTQVSTNHDALVSATRKGGKTGEQAIVDRLQSIPWANKG